jgi:hypothetical protein
VVEKVHDAPFGVVARPKRVPPAYKSHMPAELMKFDVEHLVVTRHIRNTIEHITWQERVVARTQEERGTTDPRKKPE